MGLSEQTLDIIQKTCSYFPEIQKVLIFGSRAKGSAKPGSDIDLAILGETVTDAIARKLSYQLNEETTLPYEFDIVCLNTLENNHLKEHINRVGKIIYVKILK